MFHFKPNLWDQSSIEIPVPEFHVRVSILKLLQITCRVSWDTWIPLVSECCCLPSSTFPGWTVDKGGFKCFSPRFSFSNLSKKDLVFLRRTNAESSVVFLFQGCIFIHYNYYNYKFNHCYNLGGIVSADAVTVLPVCPQSCNLFITDFLVFVWRLGRLVGVYKKKFRKRFCAFVVTEKSHL